MDNPQIKAQPILANRNIQGRIVSAATAFKNYKLITTNRLPALRVVRFSNLTVVEN